MKKGMKSVLTATILLTLSSVLGVQAADTTLEEVIVTADRTRITEDSAGSVYAGGYVGTNPLYWNFGQQRLYQDAHSGHLCNRAGY